MKIDEPIIEANNITVEYRSAHFRYNTFKEYVFNALKGKNSYSLHKALKNVSVKVNRGESVALLGHNGSGKSTLLRVLAGIIEPPNSTVLARGRIAPMIELGAGFDHELSGRENIFLSCTLMGLTQSEIQERMQDIIHFSELRDFIDIPFKNYSSGMQARLGFACATAVDPDIILADEVLSVGDSNFARKCLMRIEQLREKGTSLILVSHDSAAVKRFCSRAYVFEQGNCVFDGQISEALAFNDEIMERRYLRSLLENHDPERELGRNHIDPSNDFAEKSVNELNKPRAVGKVIALQDNLESQFIDCSKAFKLEFELAIENAQFIEDDFTVGFAIHTANGVRVFGSNNRQLGVVILKSELGGQTIEAKKYVFEFPRGLPELASGMYRVILGVHDQSLVRTLYCEEAGRIIFRNRNKQNLDNDILDVEGRCAFSASASS